MQCSVAAFDSMAITAECADDAAPTAKSLEPPSPAVKAATKDNKQYDDNDEKCGVVHALLLW